MDLKAYAIEQKLAGNGDLLDYVAHDRDIPVAVIDQNFKTILADRTNADAELLSTDYQKYLHDTVKVNIRKSSASQMQLQGHIDDNVLEVVKAFHDVDDDDIVKETITNLMYDVNPHDKIEFDQIQLAADADEFVKATQAAPVDEPTPAVEKSAPVEETTTETAPQVSDANTAQPEATTSETPETVASEDQLPPDDVPDMSFFDDQLGDSMLDEPNYDQTVEPDVTPTGELAGLGDVDQPVQSKTTPTATTTEIKPSNPTVKQAYQQAYDTLVDTLRKYGLDKRLPGLKLD